MWSVTLCMWGGGRGVGCSLLQEGRRGRTGCSILHVGRRAVAYCRWEIGGGGGGGERAIEGRDEGVRGRGGA